MTGVVQGDVLLVCYVADVASKLQIHSLATGSKQRTIPLPGLAPSPALVAAGKTASSSSPSPALQSPAQLTGLSWDVHLMSAFGLLLHQWALTACHRTCRLLTLS